MLDVTVIGCSGMLPFHDRYLSSAMIKYKGMNYLIDCGEGTQMMIRKLGLGFKAIDCIILTHFHCDHIAGLPGLLLTIGNSGRVEPLTIIGPKHIEDICKCLLVIAPSLPYDIVFKEATDSQEISLVPGELILTPFEVEHVIQCFGYSFNLFRKRKFLPEKAMDKNIPKNLWRELQNGNNIEINGVMFNSDEFLGESRKGIKLTYSTDTRPCNNLLLNAMKSDLLILEGMYGNNEPNKNAEKYDHMTIYEAAKIAVNSHSSELWLTHYSPSMTDPSVYKDEIKHYFHNTIFSYDGMTKNLRFE